MTHLIFDVSSGVDSQTLALNLSALSNLPKVTFMHENQVLHTETPYFIANILFGWFVAMGMSVMQVKIWLELCINTHFDDKDIGMHEGDIYSTAASNIRVFNEFFKTLEMHKPDPKSPTHYPLPTIIDVRLLNPLIIFIVGLLLHAGSARL